MVQRRAGQHQRVDQGGGDADGQAGSLFGGEHRAAAGGAVQVQGLAVAGVRRRQYHRPAVADVAEVTDQRLVEDAVNDIAVVVSALPVAGGSRSRGGLVCGCPSNCLDIVLVHNYMRASTIHDSRNGCGIHSGQRRRGDLFWGAWRPETRCRRSANLPAGWGECKHRRRGLPPVARSGRGRNRGAARDAGAAPAGDHTSVIAWARRARGARDLSTGNPDPALLPIAGARRRRASALLYGQPAMSLELIEHSQRGTGGRRCSGRSPRGHQRGAGRHRAGAQREPACRRPGDRRRPGLGQFAGSPCSARTFGRAGRGLTTRAAG